MSYLDVLRGLYASSPSSLRRIGGRALALLPTKALYGRGYHHWCETISSHEGDADRTAAFVEQNLREVLTLASNARFYRDHAVRPASSNVFDWLARFPILTQDDVRERASELAVRPLQELDLVTTSGSSGRPLQIWLDRGRGVREQAFIHAVWARAGFVVGDARLVLRGVQIGDVDKDPLEWEAGLRELRCSPFHLTDTFMARYADEAARRNIAFIHGYPSAIAIFARYLMRTSHVWRERVRGVFPISEPIYSQQQTVIADAFPHARILPFYGMSEKVAFAQTVEDGELEYAFQPLYGWVELIGADEQPLNAIGQQGRIVATGFTSRGMPMIRYDTGDDAELVALPSADNGWRMRVRSLHGRWRPEYLVSSDGALISIAALNVHSTAFLAVSEYLFTQSEVGRAKIVVVPASGAPSAEIEQYLNEVRAKVGRGIEFELEIVDRLEPAARGKRRFIEQKLDLGGYLA